jgi:hypothetical protein
MDDPPMTHIEAVMDVAAARRDEMRGQWRLFSVFQRPRIHVPSYRNLHHDYALRSRCCAAALRSSDHRSQHVRSTMHIVERRRELGDIAGVKAT